MQLFIASSLIAVLAATALAAPTGFEGLGAPGIGIGPGSDSNFDFNGFSHNSFNDQFQVITVEQQVCERVEVSVVQKRVAIFKELIKKTIIEQECTVETAVVIVQNFQNDFSNWIQSIHDGDGGFDSVIADLGESVFQNQDQSFQNQQIQDSNIVWRNQDIVRGNMSVPSELVNNGTDVVQENSANVTAGVDANVTATATAANATGANATAVETANRRDWPSDAPTARGLAPK